MPASKLLVYRMLASRAQIRITSGVAIALFLLFATTLFFRTQVLRPADAFVPITSTMLIMADWITATLLFAQALVLRARPLHVLAAGYFSSGLFVILRVLALPGVLAPQDAGTNIPLWFYLTSHAALPLAIMAYAWLNRALAQPPGYRSPGRTLAGAVILAGSLILASTVSETSFPWSSPIFLTTSLVLLLLIAAMITLGLTLHSVLDLWLLLVLWGWLLEVALITLASSAYTAGWYAARSLGLMSGLFVLFALLAETSKLYAQTALQLIAQTQEREHRSMIRDAITASIAHELRQPLSAILLDAHVSRQALYSHKDGKPVPPGEIAPILDDIIASGQRASDIIESTRGIFGRESPQPKILTDIGALLNSTLALVAGNARANDVLVELAVEGQPGPVAVNRLQVQQAFMNLFQNAIEALSHSSALHRTLRVRCMPWTDSPEDAGEGRGVTIRVEDNGPGIPPDDRERVFNVFYTTRPGGTGMGLAIARSVIEEAHGGSLDVEPRLPMGTAFVIHLPYDGAAA